MTFENPSSGRDNLEFREDWKALHDDADARRETAFAAKQALIYRLPAISEAERDSIQRLNKEWEEAHSLCLRCLDVYQHRTLWLGSIEAFARTHPSQSTMSMTMRMSAS